jgi:hypothetical protein
MVDSCLAAPPAAAVVAVASPSIRTSVEMGDGWESGGRLLGEILKRGR